MIAEQVRNGVAIRMALIHRALISEPGKTAPKAGVAKKKTPARKGSGD